MRQNIGCIPWLLLDEQLKYKMIAKMRQNDSRSAGSAGGEDIQYIHVLYVDVDVLLEVHVCN